MASTALIAAVKAHALANYNEGGWDYIVECWTDADIDRALTEDHATTEAEAIASVQRAASLYDERRAEVQAEIF